METLLGTGQLMPPVDQSLKNWNRTLSPTVIGLFARFCRKGVFAFMDARMELAATTLGLLMMLKSGRAPPPCLDAKMNEAKILID